MRILAALGALGCHALTPAQQARLGAFECQVAAVEPLCAPALDAAELVRGFYSGSSSLMEALGSLGATKAEVEAMVQRWNACTPGKPSIEVVPVPKADPPAYGDKLI